MTDPVAEIDRRAAVRVKQYLADNPIPEDTPKAEAKATRDAVRADALDRIRDAAAADVPRLAAEVALLKAQRDKLVDGGCPHCGGPAPKGKVESHDAVVAEAEDAVALETAIRDHLGGAADSGVGVGAQAFAPTIKKG
jgi:hypothetical protein